MTVDLKFRPSRTLSTIPDVKDSVDRFFRSFGILIDRDSIGALSDIMSADFGWMDLQRKYASLTLVGVLFTLLQAVCCLPKQRFPDLRAL